MTKSQDRVQGRGSSPTVVPSFKTGKGAVNLMHRHQHRAMQNEEIEDYAPKKR